MTKGLDEFKIGETGRIVSVDGEKRLRRRLLDMGVTYNTVITLVKKAPLGDPLQVSLRGYELTLRKEEAAMITMEVKQ